jgi:hypothetical protein
MPLPDPEITPGQVEQLVAARGTSAILIRCLEAGFDDYDSLDPAASTWDLRLVRALLSSPSEKEARALAGRGIDATKRATLSEWIEVQPDREGMGDLLLVVPNARITSLSGGWDAWDLAIMFPDPPSTEEYGGDYPTTGEYALTFGPGSVSIPGLTGDEYQVFRVADVHRDRHPFTGVTKLSVYLQEVPGV